MKIKNIRKSKKAITLVSCFIISLLINTISIATINLPILAKAIRIAEAEVEEKTDSTIKEEDKFLELRATEVKEVEGQNKQVIMELWANDVDFQGFDLRFTYDNTKVKPSNIDTNVEVTDLSNILEYFKWEDEFYNPDIEGPLDAFVIPDKENIVRMIVSFFPPATSQSTHIVDKGDGQWTVLGSGGVKLGKMSFQMTEEEFDASWFSLVKREADRTDDDDYVPENGIEINVDGNETNTLKESFRFRFTSQTSSKDAYLTGITVSKEIENEEEPSTPIYKEYDLTPSFDKETKEYTVTLLEYIDDIDIKAKLSDSKSKMKIKVPKRNAENGELVYEDDGTTISYEEKELLDDTKVNVVLNELGKQDTVITITVTAEDGKTTNEYVVTIHRPYGTIKGSIQLGANLRESMQGSYGHIVKYIANATIYNTGEFNWNGLITKETTMEELDQIDYQVQVESEEVNGEYTIYVIPGKYDLLLERLGFLANVVTEIEINENDEINIGNKVLVEGDVNRSQMIDLDDVVSIVNRRGVAEGDDTYDICYDLGQKGFIALEDVISAVNHRNEYISIEKYE
ncbi:MAG: cadherin-like beta sandwich domain-containing protein [Clostridia bacterium]|nr:cadherin-like beta sandwich domain-containing protein [Clostridia bacterium]